MLFSLIIIFYELVTTLSQHLTTLDFDALFAHIEN